MNALRRIAVIAAPACVLGPLLALALKRETPPIEPPDPFSFTDHRVALAPDSKLLARLEILEIARGSQESTAFRTVGQIIALSNISGSLTGSPVAWVELDPRMSAAAGLQLETETDVPAGLAYGLTSVPGEYASHIKAGQPVEISRYGLRKAGVSGVLTRLIPHEAGDRVDALFRFSKAQDWFPGTNCEVLFPALIGHPVRIPTTAPIHAGALEYVWKVVGPGEFAAQNVSIVDATPDEASVLGLKPGDRIVTRGAILLKPLLEPVLERTQG